MSLNKGSTKCKLCNHCENQHFFHPRFKSFVFALFAWAFLIFRWCVFSPFPVLKRKRHFPSPSITLAWNSFAIVLFDMFMILSLNKISQRNPNKFPACFKTKSNVVPILEFQSTEDWHQHRTLVSEELWSSNVTQDIWWLETKNKHVSTLCNGAMEGHHNVWVSCLLKWLEREN